MEVAIIEPPPPPMWACGFGSICHCGNRIWVLAVRSGKLLSTGGLCRAPSSGLTRLFCCVGSSSPTFLKGAHCPPILHPSWRVPAWLELGASVCWGRGWWCATHRRSQLPLDVEKSNFLPNCHRPRSLPSQPTSAWRRCVSPQPPPPTLPTPASRCPPHGGRWPPFSVTRVGTHHISCPQPGGAGGADRPPPWAP